MKPTHIFIVDYLKTVDKKDAVVLAVIQEMVGAVIKTKNPEWLGSSPDNISRQLRRLRQKTINGEPNPIYDPYIREILKGNLKKYYYGLPVSTEVANSEEEIRIKKVELTSKQKEELEEYYYSKA